VFFVVRGEIKGMGKNIRTSRDPVCKFLWKTKILARENWDRTEERRAIDLGEHKLFIRKQLKRGEHVKKFVWHIDADDHHEHALITDKNRLMRWCSCSPMVAKVDLPDDGVIDVFFLRVTDDDKRRDIFFYTGDTLFHMKPMRCGCEVEEYTLPPDVNVWEIDGRLHWYHPVQPIIAGTTARRRC